MRLDLVPHPSTPRGPVAGLTTGIVRTLAGLDIRYRLTGALHHVIVAPLAATARTDELWKHTCFEAFIRADDGKGYLELNVSPSTQWAAYSFTAYREGMHPLDIPAPVITRATDAASLEVSASINLKNQPAYARARLRLAISAVVENDAGQRSYWALAHPVDKPDFHHAGGFTLDLPAPDTTLQDTP